MEMRWFVVRPGSAVLVLAMGIVLLLGSASMAETCCACGHACSGSAADFGACYQFCQSEGDVFVNFHAGTGCSEIKACEQGACCDRRPECKEITRLGCAIDAAGKGFLAGKTCADCPERRPLTQIMVVANELVDRGDGTLVSRSYYVIVEIARLTAGSGYKGYIIRVPRTVVPDEHGDVPLEQRGDVQAGRVTREDLSNDQWKRLKEVLDGLGLNAGLSLDEIFKAVEDADVDVPPEPIPMISVSAPKEIVDPADPGGDPLGFSHWEVHRSGGDASPEVSLGFPLPDTPTVIGDPSTTGVDESLWYLHTVRGSCDISIGTNDPGSGVVLEAFLVKGHLPGGDRLADPYADWPQLILLNLGDLVPEALPGGRLTLEYEGLDECFKPYYEIDGARLDDFPDYAVRPGDDIGVKFRCEQDDYASAIPGETRDCARYLAWHSGYRHRSRFDERWDARENAPREMCDACGAPMCVVCMEYDLGTYDTRSGVTGAQRSCQWRVERYLRSATRQQSEILAAVYWEGYWDGRHNRDRPG